MLMESQKKETLLTINPFSKPADLSGIDAWCNLIIKLIMMRPGTFPSLPMMGVGLEDYEYSTVDSVIGQLTNAVNEQVATYLPDIPVEHITVTTQQWKQDTLLSFIIQFRQDRGNLPVVSAVSYKVKNIINFEVIM